jgi:hypothetical protein
MKHSIILRRIAALCWIAALTLCLGVAGASPTLPPGGSKPQDGVKLPGDVLQVDWEKLLPPSAPKPFNEPPAPVHGYLGESGPAAKQSGSSAVNAGLEGLTLRIPGFIVPLDVDAAGQVVEFLLVPYYGACIHVPPPPPNQIIYVKPMKPISVKDTFNAYWITGRMHVEIRNTQMASASYSMSASKVEAYE